NDGGMRKRPGEPPGRPASGPPVILDEEHDRRGADADQDEPADEHRHQAAAVQVPAADIFAGKHERLARLFLVHGYLRYCGNKYTTYRRRSTRPKNAALLPDGAAAGFRPDAAPASSSVRLAVSSRPAASCAFRHRGVRRL